ncbi:hypothetical protein LOK46_29680 [Methylobacterium sp. NMS14P]|uniref:hypothetical protein n=1 Tax=Methylobacterium sp. NMS14P TaxID=2894310 RepID=UPI00235987B5|nr:hypothetical protein [Methylobacterium sp. NMS14P]WCS25238.1 hypothetical protein LOK46_29680 [Methylobacterium sp. NMS14P]
MGGPTLQGVQLSDGATDRLVSTGRGPLDPNDGLPELPGSSIRGPHALAGPFAERLQLPIGLLEDALERTRECGPDRDGDVGAAARHVIPLLVDDVVRHLSRKARFFRKVRACRAVQAERQKVFRTFKNAESWRSSTRLY